MRLVGRARQSARGHLLVYFAEVTKMKADIGQRRRGASRGGRGGYMIVRQASGQGVRMWYDGATMMAKTQITLESEMQRRARQRANDLGVSLAEYFRRLVARDLARPETAAQVERIFDLGSSATLILRARRIR